MYACDPMMESCMGSLGWVTEPRAVSQQKGQCATIGRDVIGSQSLLGCESG